MNVASLKSIPVLLSALVILSSCANTVKGFVKDNRETASAVDSSTHRVLSAGARK